MSDIEDIKIIDSVLAGNMQAYGEIVRNYQDRVFRYVRSQVNNYDEAMDMTQEIFIMTLEALSSFRRESKFSTWLYSIMVNYCKNFRKKARRISEVPLNVTRGDREIELQIPDERQDPEDSVIKEDSLRIVKEEIYGLPDDYRDILILRDIEGLSYNEISEVLDINLSNVKVRIHRGREFLKNRLYARGLI